MEGKVGQRAKMSRDRGGDGAGTWLAWTRAEEAEREARAILAETEPMAGGSFYVQDARGLRAGGRLPRRRSPRVRGGLSHDAR